MNIVVDRPKEVVAAAQRVGQVLPSRHQMNHPNLQDVFLVFPLPMCRLRLREYRE